VELETRDIKEAGVYNAKVRLHVGVVANFKVNVELTQA
jgi:large subunit ribosomal protein L9